MKFFKALFLFLLLGGDYGLDLASLEAFPTQALGCDGRANILFAPISPFLLRCPLFLGGTILITVTVFLTSFIATSMTVSTFMTVNSMADLGKPIHIS